MATSHAPNSLYFGDNLDILRQHVADESVDLIYLDPPFNSNATYNVLFRERSGEESAAQITAFDDTWRWSMESELAYQDVVTQQGGKVGELLAAMRAFLGQNDMMAYLTMMAQRMVELHRVLKPTGSIYLHCDPTASHYLKLLMDVVFGADNFRNEIVWKRTSGHSDAKRFGRVHDVILYYAASEKAIWNATYQPYETGYVEQYYRYKDPDGRLWMSDNLSASGLQGGGYEYEWKGITRVWRVPESTMERLDSEGRVFYTRNGIARRKRYLDEQKGLRAQDNWTDIQALRSWHDERLGYPTQKPEALLERIISASSNEGDVVLDPFCGCGTAVAAAERLNRRWVGIDITHLAITLIRHRLHDTFGEELRPYEVVGEPKDLPGAESLALHDRYQFEWWALGLVDARPARDRKKGADAGIDGYINFFDDNSGKPKRIVVQVKSGGVQRNQIATLKSDMEREKADLALFVTLNPPTRPMEQEALEAGFYAPEAFPDHRFPRVQILTIEDLLAGAQPQYPRYAPAATFRRAPRRRRQGRQARLG
ncbi:MAG: site-specific DNA-methyltransferase [Chloroflexi bacterium]|nr:site-specific DNA-methyltransferase [Chloroflexota bacterium]